MKFNILITGAAGFIGSSLAIALATHNVFLMARNRGESNIPGEWIVRDLSLPLNPTKLPRKLDIIIHEAAKIGSTVPEGDKEAWLVNVEATEDLLKYGNKVGISKFIYASTGSVYGYREKPSTEEAAPNPPNFYTKTKLEAERLVQDYSKYFNTLIFRYFYPYGPGQKKGLIHRLATNISSGEPIIVYNREENPQINPIYIDDLVRLTIKSLDLGESEIINLAGSDTASIKKISEIIADHLRKKPVFDYQRNKEIKNEIGDISRMEELLGSPKVNLTTGIKRFLGSKISIKY